MCSQWMECRARTSEMGRRALMDSNANIHSIFRWNHVLWGDNGKKESRPYLVLLWKSRSWALARWFSWLEHRPRHRKVADLIPISDTYNPRFECTREATNRCFSLTSMFLSLSSFLPYSLSESNRKKNVLGWGLKKSTSWSMKSTVVMILVPLSIQFNLTNMYWGYLCAKQFA